MSEGDKPRFYTSEARVIRMNRRRDRIVDEIQRNRRGENGIPTWVLAAILVLIVVGVTALVIFA